MLSELRGRRAVTTALGVLTLAAVLAWSLAPMAWLFITSIKPSTLTFAIPPVWRFTPTLENYASVIAHPDFAPYLFNTLVVATATSVLAATMGGLSAYAFTRFEFRGSQGLPLFYLVLRMVPRVVLVVPYYVIVSKLGLLNTKSAMIASYVTFALPFAIWMMIGFLKEVPPDMEEAARVDGCNRLQVLWHIVVPVALPGIVTTALFAFLLGWNEFMFALILAGPDSRTMPILISSFDSERGYEWGRMSAAATLVVIPVILLAMRLQRHILRGLTLGAVKG